ncbi:MAG: hypothetical protein J2P31_01640, partial [Blastocatellia bacterium]|nr:hypothetical protein [Blastocatellia bacterium]
MGILINQLLGFLVGLLSSWALWYYLLHIKPKIEISPNLAYNPKNGTLHVKVRNGRRRQVTDIRSSLAVVERKPNGRLLTLHIARLKRDTLFVLAPIQELKVPWGLPATFVFSTDDGKVMLEKLEEQADGERRIIFVISATDGLSGAKIVRQVSFRPENIKQGIFGLDFTINELSSGAADQDDENVAAKMEKT